MKAKLGQIILGIILIASLAVIPGAGAVTMGYTDPTGDLDNEGMPPGVIPNVDIVELRVDDSGDTVVAEMDVDGIIDYEETYDHERLYYHYHIEFELTGDSQRDCWIEIDTNAETYVFHVPSSSDMNDLSGMFSGQNTSTLRVEVPKAWFEGNAILDISASTTVGDLMDYCDDDVNEDFEGGTPIGGDDDDVVVDDDDVADDDTVDDDTADDDTTDDDTTDDDSTDDDTDDDDDDSPGFEIFLLMPALIAVALISMLWRRKRS
ncbi:MAG: hypothetical protein ACMUIE_00575 [Thermoplasmatota archaeon]